MDNNEELIEIVKKVKNEITSFAQTYKDLSDKIEATRSDYTNVATERDRKVQDLANVNNHKIEIQNEIARLNAMNDPAYNGDYSEELKAAALERIQNDPIIFNKLVEDARNGLGTNSAPTYMSFDYANMTPEEIAKQQIEDTVQYGGSLLTSTIKDIIAENRRKIETLNQELMNTQDEVKKVNNSINANGTNLANINKLTNNSLNETFDLINEFNEHKNRLNAIKAEIDKKIALYSELAAKREEIIKEQKEKFGYADEEDSKILEKYQKKVRVLKGTKDSLIGKYEKIFDLDFQKYEEIINGKSNPSQTELEIINKELQQFKASNIDEVIKKLEIIDNKIESVESKYDKIFINNNNGKITYTYMVDTFKFTGDSVESAIEKGRNYSKFASLTDDEFLERPVKILEENQDEIKTTIADAMKKINEVNINPNQNTNGNGQNPQPQPTNGNGQNTQPQPTNGNGQNTQPQPTNGNGQNTQSQPTNGNGQNPQSQPTNGNGQTAQSQPTNGNGQNPQQPTNGNGQNPQQPTNGNGQNPQQPTNGNGQTAQSQPTNGNGQTVSANSFTSDVITQKALRVSKIHKALKTASIVLPIACLGLICPVAGIAAGLHGVALSAALATTGAVGLALEPAAIIGAVKTNLPNILKRKEETLKNRINNYSGDVKVEIDKDNNNMTFTTINGNTLTDQNVINDVNNIIDSTFNYDENRQNNNNLNINNVNTEYVKRINDVINNNVKTANLSQGNNANSNNAQSSQNANAQNILNGINNSQTLSQQNAQQNAQPQPTNGNGQTAQTAAQQNAQPQPTNGNGQTAQTTAQQNAQNILNGINNGQALSQQNAQQTTQNPVNFIDIDTIAKDDNLIPDPNTQDYISAANDYRMDRIQNDAQIGYENLEDSEKTYFDSQMEYLKHEFENGVKAPSSIMDIVYNYYNSNSRSR